MNDCTTLGYVLRRARQAKQLRQADLARLADVHQRQISRFERDQRRPSATVWSRLAPALCLPVVMLSRLGFSSVKGRRADLFRVRKPRFEPRSDRRTAQRLLRLRREAPALFKAWWAQLKKRPDWTHVREFLLRVPADSRHEMEAWIHQLREHADPDRLSTLGCDFRRLPHVNPEDLALVADRRIPALVRVNRDWVGVIFPQVPLLTFGEVVKVDGLVGLKVGTTLRWCVVEFDGQGHDFSDTRNLAQMLQMPIIRYKPRDIRGKGFAARLWVDVRAALFPDRTTSVE